MDRVNITDINKEELTDLRDVVIDTDKPIGERLCKFGEETNNFYLNKIGDFVIKVSYMDTGATFNDRMKAYISKQFESDF